MTDLITEIYGGGEAAVDAASRLAGSPRWRSATESPPSPYETVIVSRGGRVWAAEYRKPEAIDRLEGGPENPWWMMFKGPNWPTRNLSWAGFSEVEPGDRWMALPSPAGE